MNTDVEKSFTAKLAYNDKKNDGSSILINIDFCSLASTQKAGNVSPLHYERISTGSEIVPGEYLCANAKAATSVELYFRYDSGRGAYRIWVRDGNCQGGLLADSNNGYIYASRNYDRPHLFWLYQPDENGTWRTITIDQYAPSTPFRIQQADTQTNIGVYSKNIPFSGEPSIWWAYITTGSESDKFVLNAIKKGVDYARTDVWGVGKA
ncbi:MULTISPECIES: hypothetical protein [Pseudomonas]|uniref:Uncharacterized protein n=4 Tax=Pseudomonas syringae group TaxID=136849 RepID=A0A3M5WSH2_9PSED|nr:MULTISPECIES: hypothetical protein [Pseudomonas]EGH72238.1 hypothetical protein PSYAR_16915 [Pseudomonas syringae pv. aceris str. M302273]KPW14293.1 hypothetical protein ALO91_102809 [Pseudomonas syringae pv. aceris]KPY57214.1 Uncharacterized protein ALO46_01931 [Pseudomonas syringae pv. solidagae]KWS08430.1 hypothetical protein AL064_17510 [Pseudomonas syringae pv. syringae]KWS27651.1 hypothetical protein AL061_11735 [Pseudomonas syringae pv. syringae]